MAGFDPSSGAGVTADLMVFAAHGLNGTSAITALTVQSSRGVAGVHPVDAQVFRATVEHLEQDVPPAGIKIGMLGSSAIVGAVCDHLERLRREPKLRTPPIVVLDPTLRSSSGRDLLDPDGIDLLRQQLLPLVNWVTPNLEELSLLTGMRVDSRDAMEEASHRLADSYPGIGVLAKGGHIDPPDDLVLLPDGTAHWLPGRRVETRATHGTGCALSSAFLSQLVLGSAPVEAARLAKAYVWGALSSAMLTGSGPCRMNHLWNLDKSKD